MSAVQSIVFFTYTWHPSSAEEKKQINKGIFTKENTLWMKESFARFKVLSMIYSSPNGKFWSFLEIAVPGQGWLVIMCEQRCLTPSLPWELFIFPRIITLFILGGALGPLVLLSDLRSSSKGFFAGGPNPAGVQWLPASLCFLLFEEERGKDQIQRGIYCLWNTTHPLGSRGKGKDYKINWNILLQN